MLGSNALPLIELITNQDGIDNEIPLFSEENTFVGSVATKMQYKERPSFNEAVHHQRCGNLLISFAKLLHYLQPSF